MDVGDGEGREGRREILVEHGVIKEIGPVLVVPTGTRIVDLSQKTVLQGSSTAHAHYLPAGKLLPGRFRRTPIDVAITAHVYAKRTLEAGFTTIRDVGR